MKQKNYQTHYQTLQTQLTTLDSTYNKISLFRLLIFISGIILMIIFKNLIGLIFLLAGFITFCVLINKHNQIEKSIKKLKAESIVTEKMLNRFDSTYKTFPDTGTQYQTPDFHPGTDLDIFGKSSLYQLICRAYTKEGKEKFVSVLKNGFKRPEEIKKEQEAVKEIISNETFSKEFETGLALMTAFKKSDDITAAELSSLSLPKTPFVLKALSYILPVVSFASVILLIADIKPVIFAAVAVTGFALSFTLSCLADALSSQTMSALEKVRKCADSYYETALLFSKTDFSSEKLLEIKKSFESTDFLNAVLKLRKISAKAEYRSNGIAFFLFNLCFMWDVHCLSAFEKWFEKNGKNISVWTESIAETETLLSLSTIGELFENTVFPEITDDKKPSFGFKNLRHPLISEEKAIGNSADFSASSVIVTGSNMSGKTTFIRSIGTALILAFAGAPVTADEFKTSVMKVNTSIRTSDSVADGISTFYAELLRIKEMVDCADKKESAVYFIDEIFKGTNSKDRIVCAKETIGRLTGEDSIVFVTTHDFELCSADFSGVTPINLHFCEHYENDEIRFDYKLKEGMCKTTNAKELLKMVGISKEITK